MSGKSRRLTDVDSAKQFPEDVKIVPWNEWSDSELNVEKWDSPKSPDDGFFWDTETVMMPPSLSVHKWIRARELANLSAPPTVFVPGGEQFDFSRNNGHILHSEFARWFISSVVDLQYCGRSGLEVASEGNFLWNNANQPWQGWFNVYSLNKAGKGAAHRPSFNTHGKYIVRLFFMGCWRRFLVDDRIPVDEEGKPLLPCTANNFELWPMLLAKALLKIASLSWTPIREITDFSVITCLTGWLCLSLDVTHLSTRSKWDFLRKYADRFEWSSQTMDFDGRFLNSDGESRRKQIKESHEPSTVLFIVVSEMTNLSSGNVPSTAPCSGYLIYVELLRDVPLDPGEVKAPLAKWKNYRWLDWAIDRNLINPVDYFVPIRYLKMVSPLGSQKESVKSGILETPHEEEHQKHHKTSKPETVKSKKGSLLKSIESTKEEVNVSLDTGFWGDFNKMSAYVKAVQLFYKPWHFAYSSKISDTFDSQGESKAKSTTGKDSKKKDAKASTPEHLFRDRYRCSSKLRKSKNEPLYLLVDSVQLKFFLVEFSTSKVRKCEDSDSVLLETSESSSYAVIEAHNFCSRPVGDEPVAELKTKGTKSIVFELEPGRHLFSIFVHSETAFFMKILSDTVFYIGNRQTMYEIMSMESCLVDDYVKRVSDGLNDALQAFGTPDYRTKLKRYYQSYIPADKESSNRLNRRRPSKKRKTRKIHSLFSEGLSWAVTSSFPEISGDILRALRIFFINPDIGINDHRSSTSLDNINYSYYELRSRRLGRSRSEEMTGEDYEPIDYDRAALLIQSFFRRVLIKRYMQQHDPNHPKHRSILEQLFKLAELFNYNKRESIANVLFRNLMKRDPSLCGFYPCAKEFQHVLQVQKCSGILNNVSPGRWIPIVRLSINVPANTTTQMFADLFISLPRYTIRVFNNDTAREIFRIANDVAPTNFRHSRLGYTVFCYGWSEANRYKELNWELNLVSVKGDVMFYQLENMEKISPLSNISRLVCKEFFNNYIPNIWKLIGRWSLEVTSTTIASFRFRVSFDRVKIKLKILKDDKVLKELVGGHTIILPLVRLVKNEDQSVADARKEWKGKNQDNDEAYERSEKETKDYYLEAYVLDDSWPLLESDWVVVDAAKKRGPNAGIKMSKPSSMSLSRPLTAELAKSKHGTKKSLDINYLMESPYWVLQVISDAGSDIGVVQDTRREEEIAEMKSVWVADKPDRLQQGCRLREEFLNKNRIVLEPSEVVSKKKISTIVSQHKDVNSSNTARLLSQLSDDNQRTLVPPENMKNLLPKLDLTIYMVKEDEEEDRWYKTEYDEEMLRSHRAVNMFDFEQYYLGFLEESNDILNSQRQKYSRLLNNYSESVSRRKSLLNTAYETRTVFIDSAEPFPSEVEDKQKRKKKK